MKIGAIVGSLRKKSANRVLFEKLQALMPAGVEVYEIRTDDIGLFNQDNEFPTPDNILRLRDEFSRADGVWLFTPEYNHSYPAHVKNIIDWLSRPLAGPGQCDRRQAHDFFLKDGKSGTTSVRISSLNRFYLCGSDDPSCGPRRAVVAHRKTGSMCR